MSYNTDISSRFALDVNGVESLKRQARSDPGTALRSVSSQFEALLLQMMLKSMREASDSASSTDSQDTKMYKSMLDQQLTVALSKRGIGLADVMTRQLARGQASEAPAQDGAAAEGAKLEADAPHPARDLDAAPMRVRIRPASAPVPQASAVAPAPAAVPAAAPVATPAAPAPGLGDTVRKFVSRLWPHAQEAARTTGVAPHFILGQAALESGWGRSEIRTADGSPSHNLFGVKAGRGWQGPTADVVTTEYVNGSPVKSVERFRAYSSYTEAFRDYANLLAANPRYAQVLNERTDPAAFARGLQRAGYATDPNYADKLTRVITGTLMRAGLSG